MKKHLIVAALGFCFSGCLSSNPSCDDKNVLSLVEQIIREEPKILLGAGLLLSQDSKINLFGMAMGGGLLFNSDLQEYVQKNTKLSFNSFMTLDNDNEKQTLCRATLKATFPKMSDDFKKKFEEIGGFLDETLIYGGGAFEKQIRYTAQYTDDGKQIYVQAAFEQE
ncbi:MAG: hypothetical protein J1E28_07180 [Helicobacter sp.]|uniref:hypothetical protein n=1 Tax=Helicobacter sp. TaxID=218 RepID=UPI0025BD057D|nr:hypothetical protein [Helicobacter sp.]MCH5314154.1 hypothetical protein [Helicobacter sp.]